MEEEDINDFPRKRALSTREVRLATEIYTNSIKQQKIRDEKLILENKKFGGKLSRYASKFDQLPLIKGKYYISDGKYNDIDNMVSEEDLPEGIYKNAARLYRKAIEIYNYEDIDFGEFGLSKENTEHSKFIMHLRFVYG